MYETDVDEREFANLFSYPEIEIGDSEELDYRVNNPWNQPLGRISEYTKPIRLRPYHYKLASRARLVSSKMIGIRNHLHLIEETCPIKKVKRRELNNLRLRSLKFPSIRIKKDVCCLIDHRGWHKNHFHWFIDFLPRIIAVEDHAARTGMSPMLLVAEDMNELHQSSLQYLGWDTARQIQVDPERTGTSVQVETLIAASGARHQSMTSSPRDAMSPGMVRQIADRLSAKTPGNRNDCLQAQRIYLSRRNTGSRRVLNEDDLMEKIAPYGFVSVLADELPLEEQIRLFRTATHIIAPHGAALTNLIFTERAKVQEVFSKNHGIRPDYFQIASLRDLDYHMLVSDSVNKQDDMIVDTNLIGEYLDLVL